MVSSDLGSCQNSREIRAPTTNVSNRFDNEIYRLRLLQKLRLHNVVYCRQKPVGHLGTEATSTLNCGLVYEESKAEIKIQIQNCLLFLILHQQSIDSKTNIMLITLSLFYQCIFRGKKHFLSFEFNVTKVWPFTNRLFGVGRCDIFSPLVMEKPQSCINPLILSQ